MATTRGRPRWTPPCSRRWGSGRLADLAALDPTAVDAAVSTGCPRRSSSPGVAEASSLAGEVLAYEAPTYYGMLVAAYR
jgi:aromatic ring-opening dioxygenase LigB subunit